jgi:Outer membrane efflux protein
MPALSGLWLYIIVLGLTSALGACSPLPDTPSPTRSVVPEDMISDRQLPLRPWAPEFHPVPGAVGRPGYAQSLTLGGAVARVIAFNPGIKAAFLELEAKHGEEAQASFKPNPDLLLEVENFGGGKERSGFEAAEETLSLTQTIELGDKRLRRLRAAHLDASLAGWDYEAVRLQTALQAAQAYMDTLGAQERLKVLRDFVSIAEKTRSSVEIRVKEGRASPIDADRSLVAVARARALVKGEEARLDAAKRKLSALWGSERPDFGRLAGRFRHRHTVPSFEAVKSFLQGNPALARWSDGISHRLALLKVEQSKAVRDMTMTLPRSSPRYPCPFRSSTAMAAPSRRHKGGSSKRNMKRVQRALSSSVRSSRPWVSSKSPRRSCNRCRSRCCRPRKRHLIVCRSATTRVASTSSICLRRNAPYSRRDSSLSPPRPTTRRPASRLNR